MNEEYGQALFVHNFPHQERIQQHLLLHLFLNSKNFHSWSKYVIITQSFKNKVEFIDDITNKPIKEDMLLGLSHMVSS